MCVANTSRNYFRNVVSTVVLWSRFLFSICYAHVLLSVFLWSRFLFSICYAHVLLSVVLWSPFLFSICYAHVLLSVVWWSRFLFSICYAHVLLFDILRDRKCKKNNLIHTPLHSRLFACMKKNQHYLERAKVIWLHLLILNEYEVNMSIIYIKK
jgi:hypothetical protein